MLDAQLFLQPQSVPHLEDILNYKGSFFGLSPYFTNTIVALELCRNHGAPNMNSLVTIATRVRLSHSHKCMCKADNPRGNKRLEERYRFFQTKNVPQGIIQLRIVTELSASVV
jgi:hypothetical protein